MLEPLNTVDNPGYFLTGSMQARRIIEQVGPENVGMQYDIYHMQIMEGRLADSIAAHLDLIGHIQISGVPGRHEPDDQQEINYPYLLWRSSMRWATTAGSAASTVRAREHSKG